MNKSILGAGVAVMLGLAFSGAMLPVAVKSFRAAERTVSVKGLCEREVNADKVIWPIRYKVSGNDLATVYADIEKKNATIDAFLKAGGIDAAEICASVPEISDKYTQEYGGNDRQFRYVATSIITVCTKDVDKVLALMDTQNALIKKGIVPESNWDCKPSFSFEGLNSIKPEMIQEATRNARASAQRIAFDSKSRLGKIKIANQGTVSIVDRDSNTPQIKTVRVVTSVVYYLNK